MTRTRSPAERRAMFARMGKDYHAMNRDMSVRAANTLPDTPENRKEWVKDSRRIDIEGIDTPIDKSSPEEKYKVGDKVKFEFEGRIVDGVIGYSKPFGNREAELGVKLGESLWLPTKYIVEEIDTPIVRKLPEEKTDKLNVPYSIGDTIVLESGADGEIIKITKDNIVFQQSVRVGDGLKYETHTVSLKDKKMVHRKDFSGEPTEKWDLKTYYGEPPTKKINSSPKGAPSAPDDKYIVTAFVKKSGKREIISKPISLEKANELKNSDEAMLKNATFDNKWAKGFKIEKVEADTKTDFKADDTLLSKELLRNAHAGTSFDPEKRAETEKEYFKIEVESVYKELKGFAKTDKQKSELKDEMVKFQKRYAEKFNDTLASRGRMLSPMITGPANFPTRKNEKAYSSYENKVRENTKFRDKVVAGITKRWRKENVADAGGERAVLEKKLKVAQENHQQMKDINVIMRKKSSDADKRKQLESIGVSETLIRDVFKPDYMGRTGFQGFHLQNSNARIKSAKARLASIEKRETTKITSGTINGVKIVDNTEDNRIQLFFDGKPDDTMRKKLKGSGWRWAPSVGAWQRIRTDNAMRSAKQILKGD